MSVLENSPLGLSDEARTGLLNLQAEIQRDSTFIEAISASEGTVTTPEQRLDRLEKNLLDPTSRAVQAERNQRRVYSELAHL